VTKQSNSLAAYVLE